MLCRTVPASTIASCKFLECDSTILGITLSSVITVLNCGASRKTLKVFHGFPYLIGNIIFQVYKCCVEVGFHLPLFPFLYGIRREILGVNGRDIISNFVDGAGLFPSGKMLFDCIMLKTMPTKMATGSSITISVNGQLKLLTGSCLLAAGLSSRKSFVNINFSYQF